MLAYNTDINDIKVMLLSPSTCEDCMKNIEIERRFLLKVPRPVPAYADRLTQFYFAHDNLAIRMRFKADTPISFDIKAHQGKGVSSELTALFKDIPNASLYSLLLASGLPYIEKWRHHIIGEDGLNWEIDTFLWPFQGFQIAEVELEDINQPVALPAWAGEEITGQVVWSNRSLAKFGLPIEPKN